MNPDRDTTIEAIVTAIAQHLNSRWPNCVAAFSAYDRVPSDPSAYPHLLVHRLTASGETLEDCRGVVRYMLMAQTEREVLPGQMRSVQLAIAECLRSYDAGDVPFLHQIPPQRFTCRERILGFQNGLIPFLEVEFIFHDLEPLCPA